jgi:hypothetical protein
VPALKISARAVSFTGRALASSHAHNAHVKIAGARRRVILDVVHDWDSVTTETTLTESG